MPQNENHDGDQAEDEQHRSNTGRLDVFSRMLAIPRLESFDPTQGGNDGRPVEFFRGPCRDCGGREAR